MILKKALSIVWLVAFFAHMLLIEQIGQSVYFTIPALAVAGLIFLGWPANGRLAAGFSE